MSHLERMRAKQKQAGPSPGQTPAVVVPKAEPVPAVAEKQKASGVIRYQCGHEGNVGKCPACQVAKRRAKHAKYLANKKARKPDTGRLPEGSRFDVRYDAERQQWTGTLFVPGVATFSGAESAVFRLLGTLDAQYRAEVAKANPPA